MLLLKQGRISRTFNNAIVGKLGSDSEKLKLFHSLGLTDNLIDLYCARGDYINAYRTMLSNGEIKRAFQLISDNTDANLASQAEAQVLADYATFQSFCDAIKNQDTDLSRHSEYFDPINSSMFSVADYDTIISFLCQRLGHKDGKKLLEMLQKTDIKDSSRCVYTLLVSGSNI